MRYVDRDQGGKISGSFARPQYPNQERLADDHPDMIAFAGRLSAQKDAEEEARVWMDGLRERWAALEARVAELKKADRRAP